MFIILKKYSNYSISKQNNALIIKNNKVSLRPY
jgi:hypothetical protein